MINKQSTLYKTHPICISAKFTVKINKRSQCNDTYAWWHTWIVSQMLTESMILIYYLPYIGKDPSFLQSSSTWWNRVLGFRCLQSFPFCICCFFHKTISWTLHLHLLGVMYGLFSTFISNLLAIPTNCILTSCNYVTTLVFSCSSCT